MGQRRSFLYLPASSERMLEKARSRGADVLVFDFEDGVHPDHKEDARKTLRDAFGRLDWGASEAFVRMNGVETPWFDKDLEAVTTLSPNGAVLPKAEDPERVEDVCKKLDTIPLFLMIETAGGVLRAPDLARVDGVAGLVFGAADYRESVGAGRSIEEWELGFARHHVLLAARRAGIHAVDTPWFEYKDLTGLETSARRVKLMGFDAKSAIHPSQVPVINRIFSPSPAEIVRARRVVSVLEEALAEGRNVATLDDEMVEALHLKGARRILTRIGELPPRDAS